MNNEEKILDLLTGVKQEMSGMKHEMSGINSRLGNVEKDISIMKQEQSSMKQDISGIKQEQTGIRQDIFSMNDRLDNVEGQLEENTAILRALEHREEESSAKFEGLYVNIAREHGLIRAEMKVGFDELENNVGKIIENKLTGIYTVIGQHSVKLASVK